MLNSNEFGAKIADLRKKKGLTQTQLAEMLNISNKTVSRWETGEGYPEITLLSPLAKALGVTVDNLLSEASSESFGKDRERLKPKKHKEIPVEWPRVKLKEALKRPMTGINIIQTAFFIIFAAAVFYCSQKREITPLKWSGNGGSSSGAGYFCLDTTGYIILAAMMLYLVSLIFVHIYYYNSGKISKPVMIRNTLLSSVYTLCIFFNYSYVRGKSGYHSIGENTDDKIYEYIDGSFFNCDFFKVNRQIIMYAFLVAFLLYIISEMVRLRKKKNESHICHENEVTFWQSLIIFNKIGLVCIAICLIAPLICFLTIVVFQTSLLPITGSLAVDMPPVILTIIGILPKLGLVSSAAGLILGALDLYDRQYKTSVIIIGCNLILPYIIGFITVFLFLYPY